MINLENIRCSFGNTLVLDNLSFNIKEGEIIGIFGPNGSGKSTLLNVITGLVKPSSGKVHFQGVDITRKSVHKISRLGIGRTFQSARLFPSLSVQEVLSLGQVDQSKAVELLSELSPKVKQNTLISQLSTGQRRCVEIARLLASNASLFVFDEPFAGLSQRARKIFSEHIKNLGNNKSVLMCDHDEDYLRRTTHEVRLMADGKFEES